MSNYAPYITLSVNHEYFSNSHAKVPINLVPTDNTVQWLKQHYMFLKPTVNGLCVVADVDMLKEISAPNSPTLLQFKVFSNDALFRNYTDIPLSTPMSVALFEIHLNSESPLSLSPKQWLTSKDFINGDQYAAISEFELSQNLVGIINLTINKEHFYNENSQVILNYSHTYAYWQYYFFTSNESKEYQIIDSNGKHTFENIGIQHLNHKPCLVFRSNTSLPVLHHSDLSFQLKANHKIIYRRLASASPAHIEVEAVNHQPQRLCHIFLA
ncbi:hypothetical protein L3V31_15645 [Vibrio sp. J1-1]|uniref:hypothetical protein n=1 Tax=Vibrio sp. J1-1 TaxID=2912251 RepID=UPI001F2EAA12|nr:hypothetical protein [Vibrio sp. J1-1]MCF7483146.1 hypothetical protein [Vibrio sp. J1-1]